MKHRLAEECAANRDPVESTGELAAGRVRPTGGLAGGPRFDGVRITKLMQPRVVFNDLPIDPGIVASGAGFDYFRKAIVKLNLENVLAQETPQGVGHMKIFQGQDCAWIGREPFDRAVLHRHGKNTKPVTLEQKFGVDHGVQKLKRGRNSLAM